MKTCECVHSACAEKNAHPTYKCHKNATKYVQMYGKKYWLCFDCAGYAFTYLNAHRALGRSEV